MAAPDPALLFGSSFHPMPRNEPAKWMYEKLAESIIEFETKLSPDEEIGASLVNFGQKDTIAITGVGYRGDDLIIFYGINSDGRKVELLQHISQVNILLVANPVVHPRRIGFDLQAKLTPKAE